MEKLKALSGDENATLDFVEGMVFGSSDNKQFIPENRDIPTSNDHACQEKDERTEA